MRPPDARQPLKTPIPATLTLPLPTPRAPPGDFPPGTGVLRLVATPIGNLGDISMRALSILAHSDVVACEDTRVTRKLFARYGLPLRRLVAHHGHNEAAGAAGLLACLARGESVAYCSDAGTPGVSDPGYRLAVAARTAGFPVEAAPGPSAALAGLLASGLPMATFTFLGFPPRRPGRLAKFFAAERTRRHTLVMFESPRRLGRLLVAALEALGDRPAAVCLELSKKHERVRRGALSELAASGVSERGEATVVIAGAGPLRGNNPLKKPVLTPGTASASVERVKNGLNKAVFNPVSPSPPCSRRQCSLFQRTGKDRQP